MAQGESPRNPMAFASVLYPEGAWPLSQSTWVQRWSSILQTVSLAPPERKLRACRHHQDFSVNILASTTAPATAPASAPAAAPASAPAAAPAAEPRGGRGALL